jgi:3',5'-cyclic AMP phosphodiesterase CpdA
VRLLFYADPKAQPESRGSRADWTPSTSLPGGPRPPWVRGAYPVDESTGYRMNLALIASRAAESLRAGNPVLASVVGDLVESGGEQRDWDEFWRHNAGVFGTLASRVPIVAALGDHDNYGGPPSIDLLSDLGGFAGPASLIAARKFLAYFEHPDNGAADARHVGRYHRVDFGPVTLLTLDANNGPTDGSDTDTNHLLDRGKAPHVPDYTPGSEQRRWLEQALADARERGAITFVQVHHSPFSSGAHGRPPGKGAGRDERSGRPLEALAKLFREHGVLAVFSGHDEMYEHSILEGVHYYTIGTGGDDLRGPEEGVINQRQIFVAHDHAPERWKGDVLEQGGKHYGHIEVDVKRVPAAAQGADGTAPAGPGFAVTITPVHAFPLLDPEKPGEVADWERREYDDPVTLSAGRAAPRQPASAPATPTAAP